MGYLFAVLAMISFGALGVLSKLSDRRDCSPLATTLCVFGGSTILMTMVVLFFRNGDFKPPRGVIGVALAFGLVAVLSLWVFLYGIKFGKITTSWVIINLSAAVPAVASIILYKEPVSTKKIVLLLLVATSILLLWKDMKEVRKDRQTHTIQNSTESEGTDSGVA